MTTEMISYSSKSNAVRAAKQKLSKATPDLLVIDIQGMPFRTSEGVDAWFAAVELDMKPEQVVESDAALLAGFDVKYTNQAPEPEAPKPARAPRAEKASVYVPGKSTEKGATKRVWEIADSMPDAKRGEVIATCMEQGIAMGTARTQYQKWKSARG